MESEVTYSSVSELVDTAYTFQPGALTAAKTFARAKPWRGTDKERKAKFEAATIDFSRILNIEPPRVVFGVLDGTDSDRSAITLTRMRLLGRLSVVTLMFLLAMKSGMTRRDAMAWAVNLFRRAFPRSFARCDLSGPMVRNFQRISGN